MIAYLRRFILKKLEKPSKIYEQRIQNNFDKLYKIVKPGDVVLVEGRSEMSRIIKLLSGSSWSHAALYVGQIGNNTSHMLVEAFSGRGVIATPLYYYQNYNIRICRPYGIQKPDLEQVIQNVIDKLGMSYDDQNVRDIALMALNSVFRFKKMRTINACLGNCNEYQVICSGMIAQAFQSVGYPIIPAIAPQSPKDTYCDKNPYGGGLIMRHYTQISPRDFDLSPNFEIIKFNIVGSPHFDYKSLWVEKR
jgi:hypothetical protein